MPLLRTESASVEYACYGRGKPVTVFAHGVSASIPETRPLASGIAGTRVFLHFRAHGASEAFDDRYDYPVLAGDLRAVADATGATQALGVSMGSAALLHLLLDTPERFDRAVLFLPAILDQPRTDVGFERLERMADLIDADEADELAAELAQDLPEDLRDRPHVDRFVRDRAESLVGTQLGSLMRVLPTQVPMKDRSELARLTLPMLVIGQEGDDVHPASVAKEIAAELPNAQLEVFSEASALWDDRTALRRLLADFLNDDEGRQDR
ncbi:MAG TPA: alpha/beta hydrolase [Frankiaceae bacterium]|nr:alpha/beta hydrolase [Frankiaceae bacterium]